MEKPKVIISAFLDEGVPVERFKDLSQQLLVGQAVGLKYWTPRFIWNPSSGSNLNVLALSNDQVSQVVGYSRDAGLTIGCLGTAIGKQKLREVNDGNTAAYVTPAQSLELVKRGVEVAKMTDAKFLRAFSFYGIRGQEPSVFHQEALDRLGPMVEECAKAGVIYLMEIESNLVGHDAQSVLRLCRDVNSPYMLVCTDAANSHVQGKDAFQEYKAVVMAGRLGYMHIKDYTQACPEAIVVNEHALRNFGSVDVGVAGHDRIFADLSTRLEQVDAALRGIGAPGLILDVEGHMKGGGQFGGWSGPDGLGVAVRSLTDLLTDSRIPYVMRQYKDISKK